jgi:hypothetical protein
MVNVVLEQKRAALLDLVKGQAWNLVVAQPGAIENWVVLIADGSDANARVLLRDLGVDAKVTSSGAEASVVPVPRADAIRIIRPYDAELADKLATPTPMKATALVVAFGGWSILGVGRNVGIALPAASSREHSPPPPRVSSGHLVRLGVAVRLAETRSSGARPARRLEYSKRLEVFRSGPSPPRSYRETLLVVHCDGRRLSRRESRPRGSSTWCR